MDRRIMTKSSICISPVHVCTNVPMHMYVSGYTRVHLCTFDAPVATMAAIEFELEIGSEKEC